VAHGLIQYIEGYRTWPYSVEYPFSSTSGIFKPIKGLCRSHWDLVGDHRATLHDFMALSYGPACTLEKDRQRGFLFNCSRSAGKALDLSRTFEKEDFEKTLLRTRLVLWKCECLVAESPPPARGGVGLEFSSLFMFNWCGKRLYFYGYGPLYFYGKEHKPNGLLLKTLSVGLLWFCKKTFRACVSSQVVVVWCVTRVLSADEITSLYGGDKSSMYVLQIRYLENHVILSTNNFWRRALMKKLSDLLQLRVSSD